MRNLMWVGVVLVVLGIAGLAVDNISFTEERHVVDVGPVRITAEEQRTIPVPTIAGIVAVVAGFVLIFASRRPA